MDKHGYLKRLEDRFSDLTTLYHQQVVRGKTPRELLLLVLNIKSIISQMRDLTADMDNKYRLN